MTHNGIDKGPRKVRPHSIDEPLRARFIRASHKREGELRTEYFGDSVERKER